nr:helix-turn-helix domain-containing protein [Candidatus Sigynarchaeota archaeon]
MESKNSLRAQIEQLFRDNPQKSFGVSEIARQLNAKRNTIHYHLKTLKMSGFLGQNRAGEYYLGAIQGNSIVLKEGIINCRYHSQRLNAEWCPSCGNPICEACITTTPPLLDIGYPFTCPECNRKKVDKHMKLLTLLIIIINSFLAIYLPYTQNFYNYFLSLGLFALYSYISISWIKGIKHYRIWKRNIDGNEIPEETIQSLIQNKELPSCRRHPDLPAINTCEDCGSAMCIQCSTVGPGFPSRKILCIECNWNKKRIFLKFELSMLILITGDLSVLLGLFLILPGGTSFLFMMVPAVFASIAVISLVVSRYMKDKNKFYSWKSIRDISSTI